MLRRLAELAHRRPRRLLGLTALFFLVAAALGGPVAGLLKAGDDFQDPDSESVRTQERLESASRTSVGVGVVVLIRPGEAVGRPRARAKVQRVARAIRADPAVARVLSYYESRNRAQVSRDGTATYLGVVFKKLSDDAAEEAADRLKAKLEDPPTVLLGGPALAGSAIGEQVGEDIGRAEMLAFPILFLLSLVFFRGFVAALLPLYVGVITIFGAFLAMRVINEGLALSVFALNLVIGLGLGLAIDYSLFIVSRYREELARSGPGREALVRTMITAGRTVMFSTLTVAAAVASLCVFPQRFLYSMGLGGAVVALMAAATALIALPALLAALGPRVDALAPRRWQRAAERDARQEGSGFWYRLSVAVTRRPAAIATGAAAVLIAMGLPFLGVKFTGVEASNLPESSTVRQVDDALASEFPPNRTSPVSIAVTADRQREGEVASYASRLRSLPGVAAVERPRHLGGDTWQVDVVPEHGPLDERSQDLLGAIRGLDAPFPTAATGETSEFVDQQASLAAYLPLGLAVLGATTIVLLFLMTGSLVLPLKSLLMNLLSLSAAFGLLVLIFQDGRLEGVLDYTSQGALESTQPILLFAIAFGLSTDYAVFLLTRIKEARDSGLPDRQAVAVGLERTGRIVTAAALLFCVAIGAFATSEIVFIKLLGIGTALAVIIDATIVRALLVPSLMELLGRHNWWAPAPLRRLHRRMGLSETT